MARSSTTKIFGFILIGCGLFWLFQGKLAFAGWPPTGLFSGLNLNLWHNFPSITIPSAHHFFYGRMDRILEIALFLAWSMVTIWVYSNAESRGMSGLIWGLLVFFGGLIGLLVYLLFREQQKSAPPQHINRQEPYRCSGCKKSLQKDFVICPYCRTTIQNRCHSCKREIEEQWNACPFCKADL